MQEVGPSGPVPAQTSGSPQHYGKDFERFEHVREQPVLVGHASSYQQVCAACRLVNYFALVINGY